MSEPIIVGVHGPERIEVERIDLPKYEQSGSFVDGELTYLGHKFRYVSDHGPEHAVFERIG